MGPTGIEGSNGPIGESSVLHMDRYAYTSIISNQGLQPGQVFFNNSNFEMVTRVIFHQKNYDGGDLGDLLGLTNKSVEFVSTDDLSRVVRYDIASIGGVPSAMIYNVSFVHGLGDPFAEGEVLSVRFTA
jgi:hypothetical protein